METTNQNNERKLYRSRDKVIAGVCGGLAEYLGLSARAIRIITLLLVIFGGLSLWCYIIFWIIMPNAPRQ